MQIRHSYGFVLSILGAAFAFSIAMSWGCSPHTSGAATNERPAVTRDALEQRIHQFVNAYRQQQQLDPLGWNTRLLPVARQHSEDMARRQFFDHVNPDNRGPSERAAAIGFVCRKESDNYFLEGVGENIFAGHLYRSVRRTSGPGGSNTIYDWYELDDLARRIVTAWVSSEGHRLNLVNRNYGTQAIGVHISRDLQVFVTQNFC